MASKSLIASSISLLLSAIIYPLMNWSFRHVLLSILLWLVVQVSLMMKNWESYLTFFSFWYLWWVCVISMWTQPAYLAYIAVHITMYYHSCSHSNSHLSSANIHSSFVCSLFAISLHSSFYHLHMSSFMIHCFITTNDSDLLFTFPYMPSTLFLLGSSLIYQSWQLVSILVYSLWTILCTIQIWKYMTTGIYTGDVV